MTAAGVTATLCTPDTTRICAAPAFAGSAVEVALTVVTPTATPVTTPAEVTVATEGVDDVQVTVVTRPGPVVATDAASEAVPPTRTSRLAGDTVTDEITGSGAAGMETSSPQAAKATSPPSATNVRDNLNILFPL
jgi:hypothetical protein